MVEDADEPVLVALNERFERPRNIIPDLEHKANVRVSCFKLSFQDAHFSTTHE
jgi:hypothetical protein